MHFKIWMLSCKLRFFLSWLRHWNSFSIPWSMWEWDKWTFYLLWWPVTPDYDLNRLYNLTGCLSWSTNDIWVTSDSSRGAPWRLLRTTIWRFFVFSSHWRASRHPLYLLSVVSQRRLLTISTKFLLFYFLSPQLILCTQDWQLLDLEKRVSPSRGGSVISALTERLRSML